MGMLVKSQTLQLIRVVLFGTKQRTFSFSGQTFEAEEKSVSLRPRV